MNNRERVIRALQHKEVDFAPYQFDFVHQSFEKMKKFYNDDNFMDKINNHIAQVYCDVSFKEIKKGFFQDTFGVIWNRTGEDKEIGVLDNVCVDSQNFKDYVFPEIDYVKLKNNYEKLEKQNNLFRLGSIGFSLFERAWTLCGMENILVYMISDEEFVYELFDKICERNLKIIDYALKFDVDGFYFGDDWGQQKGLIMGAPLWRKFIKPQLEKMYSKVKKAGKFVFQHSCGDIEEIFPDLIGIGLDCYQTFQPEIYDIAKIKEKYGDKLTFWGGISTQNVLARGCVEQVKNEIINTLKIMNNNGGYILAPTHALDHFIPERNIDIFLKIAELQNTFLGEQENDC